MNKNDTTVKETYTIHVKLDTTNITTGHQLSEVWFTAQPNTNNTDKLIYRGIRNTTDSSCNLLIRKWSRKLLATTMWLL